VRQAARLGQNPALVGNGIVVVAIAALIGGRLYHVIDQWPRYQDDLLAIVLPPYAGLGVYGGLISGTIAAIVLTRFYRVPFPVWADIIAPALFLMQAIGRWGNFFNEEAFGAPTNLPWKLYISPPHRPPGFTPFDYFHPTFLYESLWDLAVFVILVAWLRHRLIRQPGGLFFAYVGLYSVGRFIIESVRLDSFWIGPFRVAQIASVLGVAIAIAGLAWTRRRAAAQREHSETDRAPA
jgi:phosphatidylglycerol:prolipoprotein diacylglycerol transferase